MVNTSSEICDRIGHIMNYGDGWYGGVYVAAMYALAFVSDDINYIVNEALKTIPENTLYARCMRDVIKWHKQYPDDWKMNWFQVQKNWSEDVGCPDGVFNTFNIDAKINSAWILLGLLYGEKDFGKTISISTRAGDDSDCNPASSGGILATVLGYENIPDYWKQGLAEVEPMDFKYTTMSLNDTYEMSFRHALELVKRNGGSVSGDRIEIRVQDPKPVALEVGFEGHYPSERRRLGTRFINEASFEFEGIGFAATGRVEKTGDRDHTLKVEMSIDGKAIETSKLPTLYHDRKNTLFWKYQLDKGKHRVTLKILNPSEGAHVQLDDLIVYDDAPSRPKY